LIVIPGRAKREPGIQRLWREIPGSRLSARPGMTGFLAYLTEIAAVLPIGHGAT